MDRYRKMFDQAVEQLGPERDRVDALRGSLARRCLSGGKEETVPMEKRTRFLRTAVIAAAAALLLSATAAAVAIGQGKPVAVVPAGEVTEDGILALKMSDNTGVFELEGRYYLQIQEDGEPIDITGQFSDTVPYVYTRMLPGAGQDHHADYVIGGSGRRIYAVIASYLNSDPTGKQGFTTMSFGLSGSPLWWRTYCHTYTDANSCEHFRGDGLVSQGPSRTDVFLMSLDGVAVDGQTGAVTLTVNGEERDITAELEDGTPYILTVEGREHALIAWGDDSLLPERDTPYDWSDPDDAAMITAHSASFVYGPNTHDILVYRDGDQVRYAEFIYRQEGTLRYWMAWNCPTAAEVGWLEDYAAQHGFELDWLMGNAYEAMADDPFRYNRGIPTWETVERAKQELEEQAQAAPQP